jgi:serine/threonine protein kinase
LFKRLAPTDSQGSLGAGGFGTVWKGLYQGRAVAVKEINAVGEGLLLDSFKEWQREVAVMAALRHRNLVELVGVVMKPLALVLELIPLGDLFENFHLHYDEIDAERQRLKTERQYSLADHRELAALKGSSQRQDGTTDFDALALYTARQQDWEQRLLFLTTASMYF